MPIHRSCYTHYTDWGFEYGHTTGTSSDEKELKIERDYNCTTKNAALNEQSVVIMYAESIRNV